MSTSAEPGRLLAHRAASAATLGGVMALFMIVAPYVITSYLPRGFGVAGLLCSLAICSAVLWPRRLDPARVGAWPRAFGRRMAVVAGGAVVAGLVAFLIVAVMPGYVTVMDQAHRARFVREGISEADIATGGLSARLVNGDEIPVARPCREALEDRLRATP